MRLHTAGHPIGVVNAIVARVTTSAVPRENRESTVLIADDFSGANDFSDYAAVISRLTVSEQRIPAVPVVHSVRDVDHFRDGHILCIEPNGFIRTVFRPESHHNTLFATERCNSNCLMCSHPPIDTDDVPALTDRNLRLIDLLYVPPEYLCITGGEPTLLGDGLFQILGRLKERIPSTYVHMLTNGRRFAWREFTAEFAAIEHPNLSVGIPLYSDDAPLHDYVVQAKGAFDQTVLGLHELARYGIEIEIRVVLHALSVRRLTELAHYICRNLTFVHHVSLMGMEHIGYAPRNMSELWIDPLDYQDSLEESVRILTLFGIETRIYNLQLCVLKPSLWKYSKQSISDWKNVYAPACEDCGARQQCGGFFHWTTKFQSRGIHAIH